MTVRSGHKSVMAKEVLDALAVSPGDAVVDATLGGGGHFAALLALLGEGGTIVGIDADPAAVERARDIYANDRRPERPVAHLINDNFRNLARILERVNVIPVHAVLFDLGWSGHQLSALRGFSFERDEPLLMTYGLPVGDAGEGGTTAADLVNTLPENELAELLRTYGEERFSWNIARAIVAARAKKRILTTGALVGVIEAAVPAWYRARKLHPATKTFQALRIAVNDEFRALAEGIEAAIRALAPEGRLAVITFHSGEDRIVKNALRTAAGEGRGQLEPRKPIVPSRAEILENRRARSAKLRVFKRATSPASATPSSANRAAFAHV